MKTIILTAIIASVQMASAASPYFPEQVTCQVPHFGALKALSFESGTTKENPGSLTLIGANGMIEKVNPTAGVGGIFNEYEFPSSFYSTNDALNPQFLKFETKTLGTLMVSYICNRPYAYNCEFRDGVLTPSARVQVNVNGKGILNFNGKSLPVCSRKLLKL